MVTNGRYICKLPLICFNCDGIGHFANKCPHNKKRKDEGYSKGKHTYKGKRMLSPNIGSLPLNWGILD
jgi:hypothetical protein